MGAKVIVITGPSGVGKGTLIAELLERIPELELSVSATTREPRPGEVDGREYHFLSPEEFERRVEAGDFLEHATYSGNRYGTLRSEVESRLAAGRSVVLEIEVQGARQIRESMPEADSTSASDNFVGREVAGNAADKDVATRGVETEFRSNARIGAAQDRRERILSAA